MLSPFWQNAAKEIGTSFSMANKSKLVLSWKWLNKELTYPRIGEFCQLSPMICCRIFPPLNAMASGSSMPLSSMIFLYSKHNNDSTSFS